MFLQYDLEGKIMGATEQQNLSPYIEVSNADLPKDFINYMSVLGTTTNMPKYYIKDGALFTDVNFVAPPPIINPI